MNKNVTVAAFMKASPGQEAAVRKELLSLVEPSRRDAGCVNYDLHEDTGAPGSFMFHENWTSKALLDQHLAKPDLQAILGRVSKMLVEPPRITLWEKLG